MYMMNVALAAALEIWTDTRLDPARTYGPIVIRASHVTLDGAGARVEGTGEVGVRATGVSDVTVRNVAVRGFDNGIRIEGGAGCTVERCAVSDCRCGIVVAASVHTTVRENRCVHNAGSGIALVGARDPAYPTYHAVIDANVLEQDQQGVFAQRAAWIDLSGNAYTLNGEDFRTVGEVPALATHPAPAEGDRPPVALLRGPVAAVLAGRTVQFDASQSIDPSSRGLSYRWELGDGAVETEARVSHVFAHPGFHRVGLTVNDGAQSSLAWRDVYVIENGMESGTGGGAAPWGSYGAPVTFAVDREVRLVGETSIRADVRGAAGEPAQLIYPRNQALMLPFTSYQRVRFWLRTANAAGFAGDDPVIELHQDATHFVRLTAGAGMLAHPPYVEAREGWQYVDAPVTGNDDWLREGADIATVNWISIGVRSVGGEPYAVWLDGFDVSGRSVKMRDYHLITN